MKDKSSSSIVKSNRIVIASFVGVAVIVAIAVLYARGGSLRSEAMVDGLLSEDSTQHAPEEGLYALLQDKEGLDCHTYRSNIGDPLSSLMDSPPSTCTDVPAGHLLHAQGRNTKARTRVKTSAAHLGQWAAANGYCGEVRLLMHPFGDDGSKTAQQYYSCKAAADKIAVPELCCKEQVSSTGCSLSCSSSFEFPYVSEPQTYLHMQA